MAKLGNPVPMPSLFDGRDLRAVLADQDKALEALEQAAKEATPENPTGALLRFPWADGYALYLVASVRPLVLRHVPYGDAWQIPQAHVRGLTLADVRLRVHNDKQAAKLGPWGGGE